MLAARWTRQIRPSRLAVRPALRWHSAGANAGQTDGERTIRQKLTEHFSPSELHVEDVSGGCGTFYNIVIASKQFKGLPMVKQQRLVNQTLKDEIQGIHGLQLKTVVPPDA